MTQDEKNREIAEMIQSRNKKRQEIACLKNKIDRISKALREVLNAIGAGKSLEKYYRRWHTGFRGWRYYSPACIRNYAGAK